MQAMPYEEPKSNTATYVLAVMAVILLLYIYLNISKSNPADGDKPVTPVYPTPWQCLPGFAQVLRREDNALKDVACASLDGGRSCYLGQAANIDPCEENLKFLETATGVTSLTCGEQMFGRQQETGYSKPTHWCARASTVIPGP